MNNAVYRIQKKEWMNNDNYYYKLWFYVMYGDCVTLFLSLVERERERE